MVSRPPLKSKNSVATVLLSRLVISLAAMRSGHTISSTPRSRNISRCLGASSSALVIRATVFLAFSFLAKMQVTRLILSSWSTERKRSHPPTPASCRTWGEVLSPVMVSRSVSLSRRFSSSECGSTTVILWSSSVSDCARWTPTSPSPAMIIFILFYIKKSGCKNTQLARHGKIYFIIIKNYRHIRQQELGRKKKWTKGRRQSRQTATVRQTIIAV